MTDHAVLDIAVATEDARWDEADCRLIEKAIRAAAAHLFDIWPAPAELSVLLTNDENQRALNAQWRKIDKPTNVLSFPLIVPHALPMGLLGDISIAYETINKEAQEQGKKRADHLAHLAIHGFLHILGYDHIDVEEAEAMEALEVAILSTLDIADPYRPLTDDA